jgi:hypothetical protein
VEPQYVKHTDIDFQKWDKCIKKSVNGSIYGYSWYLNIVSEDWDAIIDDKYETVMPVTFQRFLGCNILLQPPFASNLGVYSTKVLDSKMVDNFVHVLTEKFRFININLNKYNKATGSFFKIKRDIVYELDLIPSYQRISSSYNSIINQNLMEARNNKITIVQGMNSNDLVRLYLRNKSIIWKVVFRKHVNKIRMLISTAIKYRVGQIYGAYTAENNLCAAGFFVWSHQKVFFLFLGLNKTGKKQFALEALIDEFIKLHSEQNLTLRFEYSSRNKYSSIYMGFGGRRNEFMKVFRFSLFKLHI